MAHEVEHSGPPVVIPVERSAVAGDTPVATATAVPKVPTGYQQPSEPPSAVDSSTERLERAESGGLWARVRALAAALASAGEWLFGGVTVLAALALLAVTPVFQFLSLGYLLEAGGRVARSGKLRHGFPGFRKAARVGSIVLGTWLMLLPLRLLSYLAASARIIDPSGAAAQWWQWALTVATILLLIHVVAAVSRGGKLRYFFWPFNLIWLIRRFRQGGYLRDARDAVWDFLVSLRLPYYFWLGVRGFAGGFLWLFMPVTLFALNQKAPLIGFLGALLLAVAVLYVPFLQMRFATEQRFRVFFEWQAIRHQFRRAPWAFMVALVATLAFALPLYLLKIEMIPREAAWLPSLAFILFIFPARLLTGWAYGRSLRRQQPRHWVFRWSARPVMLAAAGFYVFILFFTQYTAWYGVWSFYEQHAFLLPAPFMDMP